MMLMLEWVWVKIHGRDKHDESKSGTKQKISEFRGRLWQALYIYMGFGHI